MNELVERLVGVDATHAWLGSEPRRPFAVLTLHTHGADELHRKRLIAIDVVDLVRLMNGLLVSREVLRHMVEHPEDSEEVAISQVHDRIDMLFEAARDFWAEGTNDRMNPDCVNEKHTACSGTAWDDDLDQQCACVCPCHVST